MILKERGITIAVARGHAETIEVKLTIILEDLEEIDLQSCLHARCQTVSLVVPHWWLTIIVVSEKQGSSIVERKSK